MSGDWTPIRGSTRPASPCATSTGCARRSATSSSTSTDRPTARGSRSTTAPLPGATRSVILDGVVPSDEHALGPAIAIDATGVALERFSVARTTQTLRRAAFPDLPRTLSRLRQRLRAARSRWPCRSRDRRINGNGSGVHLDMDRRRVRLLSYLAESVALLPLLIHEAATKGNFAPLAAQALKVSATTCRSHEVWHAQRGGLHRGCAVFRCTRHRPRGARGHLSGRNARSSTAGRVCEGLARRAWSMPTSSTRSTSHAGAAPVR